MSLTGLFISSETVDAGTGLTQSVVQAVLRKLLAAGTVNVQGLAHSSRVLSQTFEATARSGELVLCKFLDELKRIRTVIGRRATVVSKFELDDNAS